jgi:hypothetical protein
MSLADLAHIIMLLEVGVLPEEVGAGCCASCWAPRHPVEGVALDPVLGVLLQSRGLGEPARR